MKTVFDWQTRNAGIFFLENGAKVKNNQLGPKITGTIFGILEAKPFMDCKRWYELYPNWTEKPVFAVKYDNPAPGCTFEEANMFGNTIYIEEYEKIPLINSGAFPWEDLEIIE